MRRGTHRMQVDFPLALSGACGVPNPSRKDVHILVKPAEYVNGVPEQGVHSGTVDLENALCMEFEIVWDG